MGDKAMETRFLITRQGKNWRVDREGDFLTITNMKTGEPHKSPRGLITDNGGVEGLWANCKTQEELDAMRAYLNSHEHKAQLAKEKAEREAYKARIEQKIKEREENDEKEYQETIKGRIVEPTAHNLYIILRHFNNQNWGAWDLSEVKLLGNGFSMAQYDCDGKQATTIALTKAIEYDGEKVSKFKVGGKRNHLIKYTELHNFD